MSAYPGSSCVNNFAAMASIAPTLDASGAASGTCSTNVDGACIRGGVSVGGSAGYSLSSMGFPSTQCNAFPMFAAGNKRYTQMGWEATSNVTPLRLAHPMV